MTGYSDSSVNPQCISQYLFRKFKKQFVNQVRVLDDDRHLDEQVVMGHLQVLDALRREVAGLVKLDGHRGQTVCLEAQEALACLGSVWRKKVDLNKGTVWAGIHQVVLSQIYFRAVYNICYSSMTYNL